jgi:class 3 adenylate cyclase/tetratricopeptide (TPR) repeat protein
MQCPHCQHENPAGQKFCGECGVRLSSTCPSCGAINRPAQKFCGECGVGLGQTAARFDSPQAYTPRQLAEKILTSKSALEGERKQITVLFADMKSSLELLADRDPEEARTLLDAVLERMMEAVHHFEGTVNQVMGDGIMALFGAPLAHEDHAVRACYAALRMHESVGRYADDLRRREGLDVQIRVGLNSGEVVVRSIGNDLRMDYSAVGETAHLAGRMEQLARPGTSLLTQDTMQLVEGFIECRALGPVPVKGLGAPTQVYEVIRAHPVRSRLQAGAARGLSRFVGRAAELGHLQRVLDIVREGHGQVVGVLGEPGVGKSRLFYEFLHSSRTDGWLVLETGSAPYGRAMPYLAVINLVRSYFKIESRDDVRTIQKKVTGHLLTVDETLRDAVPAILGLLDALPEESAFRKLDPSLRRRRTQNALKAMLVGESRIQPVCLVFEDLHSIDSETERLLDTLVASLPTARLLLLINYRPEYQHGWGSKTYYTQLRIDALPRESADDLLRSLLGDDASLRLLKQTLIERTEGNPFFLEESVRTLIERRVLSGQPGAYAATATLPAVQVPRTVHAVLGARIDRLSGEQKRLLQCAAVIGKDVPFALLAAVADTPEDDLRSELAQLQAAEFLYEIALFPDLEYTFKHALTHEVAYGTVLMERRRKLHARIVEAIEQLTGDRVGEQAEQLAHHAMRGELWDKAADYARRATRRALMRSANREAVAYAEQALAALARMPSSEQVTAQKVDLQFDLRSALLPRQQLERVRRCLEEAERLASSIADQRRVCQVVGFHAGLAYLGGSPAEATAHAEHALGIAGQLGDDTLRIVPNIYLAQALHACGENRRAIEVCGANVGYLSEDRIRERFGMPGLPAVISLGWLAICHTELGEFEEGRRQAGEARQIADRYGGPFDSVYVNSAVGFTYLGQGYFERAIPPLEAALEVCKAEEVLHMYSVCTSHLGRAYVMTGRLEEGLALLELAVQQSAELRIRAAHSVWETRRAEGCLLAGRRDEALALGEAVVEQIRVQGERGYEAAALRLLGQIHAAAAEKLSHASRAAEEYFLAAARVAEALGQRPLWAHCRLGLGKLYLATGRPEAASHELALAAEAYRALGMPAWLNEAAVPQTGGVTPVGRSA